MGLTDSRRDRVELPFCHLAFEGERPLPSAYPEEMTTIGDHIRKRRLDLGLLQKQVSGCIGVNVCTVTNWELNHSEPTRRYVPTIIQFLAYTPFPLSEWYPEQLSD